MSRIATFFAKRKRLVYGVILLAVVGFFVFARTNGAVEYETAAVGKQDNLVKKVHVTGKIESAQGVSLAFEVSGKAQKVMAKSGDTVKAGQTLISLNNADVAAQVDQAQSNVESARGQLANLQAALAIQQAKLDELLIGARSEDVALSEQKLTNAQKSYTDAKNNLDSTKQKAETDLQNLYDGSQDVIQDAAAKATDALIKQTDDFFFNDSTENPQLTFLVVDTQAKYTAETGRVVAGKALTRLQAAAGSTAKNTGTIEANLQAARTEIIAIRDYLNQLQIAVNLAVGLGQSTTTAYQTAINAARTNTNSAVSSIEQRIQALAAQKAANTSLIAQAQSQLTQAESASAIAQGELTLKKAGATQEQIRAQQGYVDQAKAAVRSQEAQIRYAQSNLRGASASLDKTVLKSPVDGVVGKVDVKAGEIVTALKDIVTIVSSSKYEIKANIAEVDIAQVKIGDHATVTLDAYGSEQKFDAIVVSVDLAETVVSNVTTYVATLHFAQSDDRIKAGMTAGVDIVSDKKDGALVVPQRAISLNKAGQKVVKVLKSQGKKQVTEERLVITGLSGSDGMIEIVEGVSEGDVVILGEKKK